MNKNICSLRNLGSLSFKDIRLGEDCNWVILDKYGNKFPMKSIYFEMNNNRVTNLEVASAIHSEKFSRKYMPKELDDWTKKTNYVLFEGGLILEILDVKELGSNKVVVFFSSGVEIVYSKDVVMPLMGEEDIHYKRRFSPKALFDGSGYMFWYRQ